MQLKIANLGIDPSLENALWDVSFELPGGCLAGIAGPQGSGKSTLLRALAGLVRVHAGEALLGEADLTDPRQARRLTGYVSESHGFYTEMGVAEYLAFMASCCGVPTSEQPALVYDLLEVVDLGDAADAPIATLSRGMKQRLALARALVHDPDLLLLDEPFAGLDSRARADVGDLLQELRNMGKAILFCTSDTSHLTEAVTHVGLLNGGRLVAFGTRAEILASGQRVRLIEVRVPGDREPVAEMLRALPSVRAVVVEGPALRISFFGGDGGVQAILAALVRSGTPVTSFSEMRGGIEEALRQYTEG